MEEGRKISRGLDLGDLVFKPDQLMALLDRLWVLGAPLDPWSCGSSSLRGGNADKVLVYNRIIGDGGLRWRDLTPR
jgi:hypothetical protein